MDPLPFWNRGRTILIGDAAHAMTPNQGQGANQSLEDAEAFRLLDGSVGKDEVQEVLGRIDAIRRPRANKVLTDTRSMGAGLEARMANMDFNCGYEGVLSVVGREGEVKVSRENGVDGKVNGSVDGTTVARQEIC